MFDRSLPFICSLVMNGLRNGIGGKRRMNRQITEVFQGSETTLNGSIMVDICHYKFVQTHRKYNIKTKQNINYGLWLINNDI